MARLYPNIRNIVFAPANFPAEGVLISSLGFTTGNTIKAFRNNPGVSWTPEPGIKPFDRIYPNEEYFFFVKQQFDVPELLSLEEVFEEILLKDTPRELPYQPIMSVQWSQRQPVCLIDVTGPSLTLSITNLPNTKSGDFILLNTAGKSINLLGDDQTNNPFTTDSGVLIRATQVLENTIWK